MAKVQGYLYNRHLPSTQVLPPPERVHRSPVETDSSTYGGVDL